MLYKDGKTAPRLKDKVLGADVKGTVVDLRADKVVVSARGPWDPERPMKANEVRRELDPAGLELIYRK